MEKKPRPWEQRIPVQTRVTERTYRCPICNEILFTVPINQPVPDAKREVTCPNGHKVMVPDFRKSK